MEMHFRDGNTFSPEKSGHINKRFVLLLGRAADPYQCFQAGYSEIPAVRTG